MIEEAAEFEAGEIVFALDSGKSYEAKILKVQTSGGSTKYFLHYTGWNKRWDKWVDGASMMKKTDQLLNDQILKQNSVVSEKSKESSDDASLVPQKRISKGGILDEDEQLRRKKRRQLVQNDLEEDCAQEGDHIRLKLDFPLALKTILVDEWENITQDPCKLHRLPRATSATVAALLKDFLDTKRKKVDENQLARYIELLDGLQLYFDKSLPLILLYRQEREQVELLQRLSSSERFSPCQIYGCEHLLRLFVRLPLLFSNSQLSETELSQMQSKLNELTKFLQKNSATYILPNEYALAEQIHKDLRLQIESQNIERDGAEAMEVTETEAEAVTVE